MKIIQAIITTTSILLLTGCAWVKPTPEGEKVRVLDADEVTSCKELGTTNVSLIDKIAGINRNAEKVQKELETLARTSAAKIGGDTVVADSPVEDGQQRFIVYRCVGVTK
ncbi:DUF4156 domain-containing protein [Sedimenticola selenatireducens]|uniref:DUF4156 domain-containing protein n=1 Tax=Sedimenticola selenatireducens TaxID=191960 RepID=A0A557SKS3_9GAMM|nr:DUF4156 domain-containing protein [Sedimenticola selenatireducens]TVO77922.1 DUF4156 domain-containing protein [Sedimenticola selenatireducens]TVT65227.1 MAG: DUF4156 domain-containing protein [Sedimenticola selenatireducens]